MISSELDLFCSSVKAKRAQFPSNDCPWCQGNEYWHNSPDLCLHREILDFARWIVPTPEEKQLIGILQVRIQTAVTLIWPEARVVYTGSTLSNTIMSGDDIQFTVIKVADEEHSLAEKLDLLNKHLTAIQILRKSQIVGETIQGIEKPFAYHVNITINNIEGIIRGEREKSIIKSIPSVFPILMLMKFFIFQCRIEDKFSHDLIFQMVLYIIQSCPQQQKMNLGYICSQFLYVYGNAFNYIATGISTREGGCLFDRLMIPPQPSAESESESEKDDGNENEETEKDTHRQWLGNINWKSPQSICAEDMVHPGTFLGEGIDDVNVFRKRCYESHKQLKIDQEECKHNGGGGGEGCEQSLLLSFISRPDFTLRQRAEKIKQYQVLVGKAIESFDLADDSRRNHRQFYQRRDNRDGYNNRDGYGSGRDKGRDQWKDKQYKGNRNDNSYHKHHYDDDGNYHKGKNKNYRYDDNHRKPYKR